MGFHDGFNLVGRDLYADAQQHECNETKDAVGALSRDASCDGRSVSVAEVYSYAQEHNRDCDSRVCHDTADSTPFPDAWALKVTMTTIQPGPAVIGKVNG